MMQDENYPMTEDRLQDGIASVLSNPEMLSKLPQVMAMLKPMMETSAPTESASSPQSEKNALLSALKPFLSPERKEAVDALMRLSQLGDVLKKMK